MSSNMSEVLIDKYLLDKYLAPYDIDSEGTQLTVSMISSTNPSSYSPHVYSQLAHTFNHVAQPPLIHKMTLSQHIDQLHVTSPLPLLTPLLLILHGVLLSSSILHQCYNRPPIPVNHRSLWAIPASSSRIRLHSDLIIYIPNHHIAYMIAPNVLANSAISDNYNDQNSNGLVPRIREVRNSSCNFPDICWSTIVYDDLLMAQVSPRVALESHDAFSLSNDLHATTFTHNDTIADTLTGFSSLSLYPTSR